MGATVTDKAKTCVYSVEHYPGGFVCKWNEGRQDVPPHIGGEDGFWIEPEACEQCPCWSQIEREEKTDG